jgi:imidazole glycerol-phosphate synthase subunit HisF
MKKKRLIPVVLLRNGWLVQSKEFKRFQNIGNPMSSVKRFSEWESDELIYLNISKDQSFDMRRDDLGHPNHSSLWDILEDVSKVTFMPITVGGGVKTLEDIQSRLSLGADKVSINSQAIANPDFINKAAREFGSQCVIVSIDAKRIDNKYLVMTQGGREATSYDVKSWAKLMENSGAGEILINSVDRDGMKTGYDIDLLNEVADTVNVPVIALGGVGDFSHFAEALEQTKVDAIAAANIFQYVDQSVFLAKNYLVDRGYNIRKIFNRK